MPLMMEDVENMEVDMDDLFGDGTGLSLPSRPPPSKELHQRIDDLRGSGCCQGIAWSKWGSIASITSNGHGLEFRNLRCHPENGTWGLSKPTTITQLLNNLDGGPLKHLSWSPTGTELAVIDSAGRVTLLQIFASLNKPMGYRPCGPEAPDDLHAVVGCFWLNLAHLPNRSGQLHHYGPAVKEASGFRYDAFQAPILGPIHPIQSKSAFLYVTTNGTLRLLWLQSNGKWFESHTELESIVSSDDLITHAAICPERTPSLLIALATSSKQLCVIRAGIDWGISPNNEKPKGIPNSFNATLRIRPLAVTSWLHDVPGNTVNASHLESSMVQLSHLEFLPPCADSTNQMSPPILMAIRSYLPGSTSHYNQEVYSTVDRWEFRDRTQPVHTAFENLSSRKSADGSHPSKPVGAAQLKKLDSFTVNKIVVAMQMIHLGRVVCFAYSDSSVDYRDRITMNETFNDGDLDRVIHLSQIGFSYAEDEPCVQVALSPTSCSLAQIRSDGKIEWKQLDYRLGDIGSNMQDPRYAAMMATLALSCSTAVAMLVNCDDIIAIADNFAKSKDSFVYDWLNELTNVLRATVDYTEEAQHESLIRNTTIQLCLSIQNSLGFKGVFKPRSFTGKFSCIVLQLRSIVVLVTMVANLKIPPQSHDKKATTPLDDPEVISALAGSIHWVLDLMAWITDTLLETPRNLPPGLSLIDPSKLSLPDLLDHLHDTNNVCLHLLLSSPTRGFLTAICRRLQHLEYVAQRAIAGSASSQAGGPGQQAVAPTLRTAYHQISTLISQSPVRFMTFEALLTSLAASVTSAYQTHKPPLANNNSTGISRNTLEVKMLLGGEIPAAFKPLITELFAGVPGTTKNEDDYSTASMNGGNAIGSLARVRLEIDPANLFFADFSILEVEDDEESIQKRKHSGLTMDSFRKTWLTNPSKSSSAGAVNTNTSADLALPSGFPSAAAVTNGNANANGANGITTASPKRWRRCTRCAAVMEDVLSPRPAFHSLVMQQRRCFCAGYWDTLASGEMVA